MANPEEIKAVIRSFLVESLSLEPGTVKDDTPLISSRLIDSIIALKLVAYLEGKFGIEIAEHNVAPGTIDTINSMTAFVQSRLK